MATNTTVHPPVDFFSKLPPELVYQVILKLDLEDVFNCLFVNRRWYTLLSDLEPYWRRACLVFGLSEQVIERLIPDYPNSKALLFAAKRHRQLISSSPQANHVLTGGYPFNVHYVCKYAREELMMGTVYKNFRPCEIAVEKVCQSSVERTLTIQPSFSRIAENRIIWAHLYDETLLCASASGLWSLYSLQNGLRLFQSKGESLYDSELKIGCCSKCLTVCVSKLVTSHCDDGEAYWDVRIISIHQRTVKEKRKSIQKFSSSVTKFKLLTNNSDITVRRATFGKKKVSLVSNLPKTCHKGSCDTHTLLLQWANIVTAHRLHSREDSTMLISHRPVHTYTAPCEPEHLEASVVRCHGLNTEFEFSSDFQLLGMIFQSNLAVWDTHSSKLLSSVDIELEQYSYEEMRLLALGHIYTIIGLEFTNVLLVVATSTGQVVLKCSGFAQKHCRMVPPYIDFLSAVRVDWLSDITSPCVRRLPAVTYWNKTNRSVEGIYFGQLSDVGDDREVMESKKQSWWQRKRVS